MRQGTRLSPACRSSVYHLGPTRRRFLFGFSACPPQTLQKKPAALMASRFLGLLRMSIHEPPPLVNTYIQRIIYSVCRAFISYGYAPPLGGSVAHIHMANRHVVRLCAH